MTEFTLLFNMPQAELKLIEPNKNYSALNLRFSVFPVQNHHEPEQPRPQGHLNLPRERDTLANVANFWPVTGLYKMIAILLL